MMETLIINEICPTTTQVWVKRGALLVDVREKEEVAALAFNVPNIINIPLSEFEARYTELPKNQQLVMVCRNGDRSLRASGFLLNHGFDHVVNMKHGIVRWVKKGFPATGNLDTVLKEDTNNSCCGKNDLQKSKDSCCGALEESN